MEEVETVGRTTHKYIQKEKKKLFTFCSLPLITVIVAFVFPYRIHLGKLDYIHMNLVILNLSPVLYSPNLFHSLDQGGDGK